MAIAFLTSINLSKNELQNAVIQPLAAAPSSPALGQIYYNSTDHTLYQYNGTAWAACGAVVSVNGKSGAVVLTQDDVGDGTTYKRTHNDLTDDLVTLINGALPKSGGTMSGAIAMGSNQITGLGTPSGNADAATKKYVDDALSGLGTVLNFKGTVANTSSLPLSGMSKGDVYIVTADNSEWVWTSDSSSGTISSYEELGPTIDLSGYLAKTGGTMSGAIAMGGSKITGLGAATSNGDAVRYEQLTGLIKTATGTISTSATSAEVSYSGTLINAYATMGGSIVELDKAVAASTVTFSTAAAPSAAVTCVVVYA